MRSIKCIICQNRFIAFGSEIICPTCRDLKKNKVACPVSENKVADVEHQEHQECQEHQEQKMTCPVCGKSFIRSGRTKNKIYCSRKCKENAHQKAKDTIVKKASKAVVAISSTEVKANTDVLSKTKICRCCGKEFEAKNSLAKYCSSACRKKYNYYTKGKVCVNCGQVFHSTGQRTMYCNDCQMKLFGVMYKSQQDKYLATREFQVIETKREQNALNVRLKGKAKIFKFK